MDANHGLIRDALRHFGCYVVDTSHVGEGFPDLLVARNQRAALVEVKTAGGKLTGLQEDFRAEWIKHGPYYLVRSIEDAQRVASFFLLEG